MEIKKIHELGSDKNHEYISEYLSVPIKTHPYYIIAVDYEYRCELFDRSMQTQDTHSSAHALKVAKELSIINGVDFSDVREFLHQVQRMSFKKLTDEWIKFCLFRFKL